MSEELTQTPIMREDLIAAYMPYIEEGIDNPFDIDSQTVSDLDAAYHQQQTQINKSLPLAEKIRAEIADSTIFFDAGFTDTDLLEEIAWEWLLSSLSEADNAHRRDLADEVRAKINEIESRIKELDPDYELTDWDKSNKESWNPSRTSSPKDFYADFAYWKGQATTIDEAVAEYKHYHPEADDQAIRLEMEDAATDPI